MEEKNENKKSHVALLTVIALLTMIVVVIGATFAFLASSVATENMSNINASTEGGSDLLLINAGEDINFIANEVNFAKSLPDLKDYTTASVILHTSNENGSTHTYSIALENIVNDFEYSSGTCTSRKAGTSEVLMNNYADCKAAGNHWTTSDGVTYKCLNDLDKVEGEMYNNQLSCTGNNYIWSSDHTPELVFDLYKFITEYTERDVCENSGMYWIKTDNEEGCYDKVKTVDLTGVHSGNYTLLENQEISAISSSPATHKYYAELTLINFNHNQIINSNKSFVATLKIWRNASDSR